MDEPDLLYHQREDDELSDEDNYGGNEVAEINDTVDAFAANTRVVVHQVKVVSPFPNMYSDVCDRTEGVRASIVLLHFHKHRRIDEKMGTGKEGIRTTNPKVLRHAKCSTSTDGQTGSGCQRDLRRRLHIDIEVGSCRAGPKGKSIAIDHV
ncbi:hypothetical protein U1Q18_043460 [Sarracenia purpurea var. burkii]